MLKTTLERTDEELKQTFAALRTPRDVADLLEVEYHDLIFHLYRVPYARKYVTFEIQKRTGGTRKIEAPSSSLKILQRKLNHVLKCAHTQKPSVHSFLPGRSIKSNATVHLRRTYVFNVDLIDFFPSINFGRVRGMFKAVPYNLPEKVATVLAQVCCSQNTLPQGAPTSPMVSNMICAKMDSDLQRLAKQHRCTYTRYADDITFWTNRQSFPSEVGRVSKSGEAIPGDGLVGTIRGNGFDINPGKVRLQKNDQRQEVTGVIVNRYLNVRRKLSLFLGLI